MGKFSPDQKLKAVEREIGFRRNVYPKRIAAGFMSQDEADYQIEIMKEVLDDLHHSLIGQKSFPL